MSQATPPAGGQMPSAEGTTPGQMSPTSGQMPTTPQTPSEGDPNTAATIAKLREENKQRRLTEEAALAKLKAIEDTQLNEQQKLARDLEQAKAEAAAARQRAAKADVKVMAQQLGFVHPDDAVALIEAKLQLDGDGTASNARELLEALKKDRPQYVGQALQIPNVSPTNPGSQPGQPFFTKAQLEDFDFAMKNEAAIKQAMREGRVER
jgi:multidrug efflux pump subunit AcrA (membrane-fusion protein)